MERLRTDFVLGDVCDLELELGIEEVKVGGGVEFEVDGDCSQVVSLVRNG